MYEEIVYPSSDKKTQIHAYVWRPRSFARGVVQIVHGMAEYALRYAPLAEFLSERGFIVCAEDHLGHGAFNALGIASFAEHLGFDGFLSLSAAWNGYSLSVAAGGPQLLYDDSQRFLYSVNGTIREEGFISEFELRIGEAPVFSEDYLPYEAELRSRLDIHGVIIYSAMEYSFSRRGRSHKRDRFTIRYDFIELGYDSDHGLIALFRYGGIEAGFDEGRGYVELERELETEHSRLLLRLSSDSSFSIAVALDL